MDYQQKYGYILFHAKHDWRCKISDMSSKHIFSFSISKMFENIGIYSLGIFMIGINVYYAARCMSV